MLPNDRPTYRDPVHYRPQPIPPSRWRQPTRHRPTSNPPPGWAQALAALLPLALAALALLGN